MGGLSFAPAEADTCIRTASCCAPGGEPASSGSAGCWVWYPNTTDSVKDTETLKQTYLTTVGHNSNLLLNLSPRDDGEVDAVDMDAYRTLGSWVRETFGSPVMESKDVVVSLSTPAVLT